jgi:hypothetical protein
MRRPRWLEPCTPAVLALFLATSALPRPAAFVHRHADGGHAHVHPWGEDVVHSHDDADHDEPAAPGGGMGGIARPHRELAGHVHWQLPFQTAARAAVPEPVRVTSTRVLAPRPPLRVGHAAALPTSARAPPRSASLDS